MTKYINNYVIFAIDNDNDLHTVAKFTRFLDTLRATNQLRIQPKVCMGMYQGMPEQSYLLDRNDFENFIRESGYIDKQESVLVLHPRNYRTIALSGYLEYLQTEHYQVESLGCWTEVENPYEYEAFTLLDGKAFVCC